MRQIQLNSVKNAVLTSIYVDDRSAALNEFFRSGAEIYVLAGVLRDVIASHYEGEGEGAPRDLDIAVAHVPRRLFDGVLSRDGTMNRHGGYVMRRQGSPPWDIWRLEETIGLRKTGVECSLENVLRSFNLGCNAIALNVRTGIFTDAGAIDSIRKKRLTFADYAIRHSHATFAAKALMLHLNMQYKVPLEVGEFIQTYLQPAELLYESKKIFPGLVPLQSTKI